jgi:hypothetical protein
MTSYTPRKSVSEVYGMVKSPLTASWVTKDTGRSVTVIVVG